MSHFAWGKGTIRTASLLGGAGVGGGFTAAQIIVPSR